MQAADQTRSEAKALDEFVRVRVVDDGNILAEPIFQRRYRQAAPDFPYHVLAFCRGHEGDWLPAAYVHFSEHGELLLGGGACVDDRIVRYLPPETRQALRRAGGLYRHTLAWAVAHFADRYPAIFGYCGDKLAERVDLAVGFAKTAHPHLLVLFARELPEADRSRLIAAAHEVGPF